jgi:beta-lactamase regulating signal transducer with metallopeptidase domain
VVVSEEFLRAVPRSVLSAALAHESAHARRRDPLRIWLAQLAADLQWPVPGSARRLSAWLLALEAQRDDEALASGAAAEDLAEAILTAARLQRGPAVSLRANAAGEGDGLAWRIRRLLSRDALRGGAAAPNAFWRVCTWCVALVIGAVWLGIRYGDVVIGVLPGTGP